mmetsp:Transcript_72979/g.237274  ORF Transcript_72979/g.237274 Transcript_72979/m.237274 type:complete len:402 (+) Transcript_72979:2736-3941(+)
MWPGGTPRSFKWWSPMSIKVSMSSKPLRINGSKYWNRPMVCKNVATGLHFVVAGRAVPTAAVPAPGRPWLPPATAEAAGSRRREGEAVSRPMGEIARRPPATAGSPADTPLAPPGSAIPRQPCAVGRDVLETVAGLAAAAAIAAAMAAGAGVPGSIVVLAARPCKLLRLDLGLGEGDNGRGPPFREAAWELEGIAAAGLRTREPGALPAAPAVAAGGSVVPTRTAEAECRNVLLVEATALRCTACRATAGTLDTAAAVAAAATVAIAAAATGEALLGHAEHADAHGADSGPRGVQLKLHLRATAALRGRVQEDGTMREDVFGKASRLPIVDSDEAVAAVQVEGLQKAFQPLPRLLRLPRLPPLPQLAPRLPGLGPRLGSKLVLLPLSEPRQRVSVSNGPCR